MTAVPKRPASLCAKPDPRALLRKAFELQSKAYDLAAEALALECANLLSAHVQLFEVRSGMGTVAVFGGGSLSLISEDSAYGTGKQQAAVKALQDGMVREFNDVFTAPPEFTVTKGKNGKISFSRRW